MDWSAHQISLPAHHWTLATAALYPADRQVQPQDEIAQYGSPNAPAAPGKGAGTTPHFHVVARRAGMDRQAQV
jgi:hypothetical protein